MDHITSNSKSRYSRLAVYFLFGSGVAVLFVTAGCAAPNTASRTFSAEQAEAKRLNIERIESIGRQQEHEERMSNAEAAELASRHAPASVSTTHVFAPSF